MSESSGSSRPNKLQDFILDSIDQLRLRKARPDLERICHMVERRYGVSAGNTQAMLERLVDSKRVIKVDYKGNTSYRNAAKWGRKAGGALNRRSVVVARVLRDAVRHLQQQQTADVRAQVSSATAEDGVSVQEIEDYMKGRHVHGLLGNTKLEVALDKEVLASQLMKLPNGKFFIPKIVTNLQDFAIKNSKSLVLHTMTKVKTDESLVIKEKILPRSAVMVNKKGRPPNKRKRFKKTHGPDFVENYDSSFEEPEPKCDYCLLTAEKNRNGEAEDLLFCQDCNAKAHPSCMDYSTDLARRSRMSPWQCIDCKTCYVCDDSGNADAMLFCDACDKGYHMKCHVPAVTEKPSGKWVCCQCIYVPQKLSSKNIQNRNETKKIKTEPSASLETGIAGVPAPCELLISECEQKRKVNYFIPRSSSDNKENNEIPDASNWTVDDVANYFRGAGFPDQVSAFKEQEIDGKSLLLLKRSDVLTGLSIKLGPALKIYNHIKRLQTRRVDGHLIC